MQQSPASPSGSCVGELSHGEPAAQPKRLQPWSCSAIQAQEQTTQSRVGVLTLENLATALLATAEGTACEVCGRFTELEHKVQHSQSLEHPRSNCRAS